MDRNKLLILLLVLLVTFFAFFTALKNDFVNWDDKIYLDYNPLIKNLSAGAVKTIFKEYWNGNYHPLTILSYSVEHHLFKLSPAAYHTTNILLHLLNTLLVYFFVFFLCKKYETAVIAALFFGIHPMHVESVAWVSARKDLLYTFFYLLGMLAYQRFVNNPNKAVWYVLLLICFILSLLSKAMAVTFPLALLLVDYYTGRKFSYKIFMEKAPLLLLSFIFGILAMKAQQSAEAVHDYARFTFTDRLFFANYGLMTYLWKCIVPIKLSCFYEYPQKTGGMLPLPYYLSAGVIAALLFLLFRFFRKNKEVVFGAGFFLLNMVLVLQIIGIGDAVIAERYSYLSYLGLFFIAGCLYADTASRKPQIKSVLWVYLLVFASGFFYLTLNRCKVWRSSEVLWTDVLKQFPECGQAYSGRGEYYSMAGMHELALEDYHHAIEFSPEDFRAYNNRAITYYWFGEWDAAIADFTKAIALKPGDAKLYFNRGKSYFTTEKWKEAMGDFNKVLEINPAYNEAYLLRSKCYDAMNGKISY